MSKYSSTKRVQEIELMKGIAIIGMVFVHILEGSIDYFTDAWTLPGSIPYTLIEFLGGIPAAGVFTFAMGWGVAFSDRATPKSYLKRALQLGLLLFYVNFFYAILPGLIDPGHFGAFLDHPWAVIGFNIYSFAALCMCFFALMKKLQDKPYVRLGICITIIVAILVTTILVKPESFSGNQWVATILGIFVRQNTYSWFPLVPWATFPIMGYGAGILYRKWNNRKKFALTSLVIGVVLVTISQLVIQLNDIRNAAMNPGWIEEIDYYALTFWNIICAVGIVCLELSLAFGIMTLTKGKLNSVLSFMSYNVMNIFVAHWLFVSPLFVVLIKVTSVWSNALIALCVLIVTCLLVKFVTRLKKSKE